MADFTENGTGYNLKFNTKVLKTVETVTKTSVVSTLVKGDGVLPYQMLETLFSFGLVESETGEPVKQSKAAKMFDNVVEENGLLTVNGVIVERLQDDLGFMFR
jgi:hypothetical protein